LSFAYGSHFCLGAPLARLEAQIAINTLLQTAPNLRLAANADELEWHPNQVLHGLKSLPVMF
jgi:cytochrome P450